MGVKAFFFKTEMKISTFQDEGHNLNGACDMSNSKIQSLFHLGWYGDGTDSRPCLE